MAYALISVPLTKIVVRPAIHRVPNMTSGPAWSRIAQGFTVPQVKLQKMDCVMAHSYRIYSKNDDFSIAMLCYHVDDSSWPKWFQQLQRTLAQTLQAAINKEN
jgi:hypothetical protein